MKFSLIIVSAAIFALAGCSGGGGSSQSTKDLFSAWSVSDNSFVFDLSEGSFGSQTVIATASTGEQCTTDTTITGSQSAGSFTIANSTYVPSTGGGSDPGCSVFNDSGTYTNEGGILTLCAGANDCWSYH